jgi:hypothetical protein
MVANHAAVFVFSNGRPNCVGLSVEPDGSNLPKVGDMDEAWRLTKFVPFSCAGVGSVTVENEVAIANLNTRGYHVGRTEAVILDFPFGGKVSVEHRP